MATKRESLKLAIMKKYLFLILFLFFSTSIFGQLYYEGWQMKDPMYGVNYYSPDGFVSFQNKGNSEYHIIGYSKGKDYTVFKGTFFYVKSDGEDYVYAGELSYKNVYCDRVLLRTGIKLSEYAGASSVSRYNVLRFIFCHAYENGKTEPYRLLKLNFLE